MRIVAEGTPSGNTNPVNGRHVFLLDGFQVVLQLFNLPSSLRLVFLAEVAVKTVFWPFNQKLRSGINLRDEVITWRAMTNVTVDRAVSTSTPVADKFFVTGGATGSTVLRNGIGRRDG